jgi:hypothetical protein
MDLFNQQVKRKSRLIAEAVCGRSDLKLQQGGGQVAGGSRTHRRSSLPGERVYGIESFALAISMNLAAR